MHADISTGRLLYSRSAVALLNLSTLRFRRSWKPEFAAFADLFESAPFSYISRFVYSLFVKITIRYIYVYIKKSYIAFQ